VHRIDKPSAAAALPTPGPVGTPGFFTEGNPILSIAPTVVSGDWANAVQEELARAIEAEGLTMDKGDMGQLAKVLQRVRGNGGFANLLHNPEFDIAQRGPSAAINPTDPGTNTFAVLAGDRWRIKLGGVNDAGSWTSSIDSLPTVNDLPPSRATSFATLVRTTNSGSGVRPQIEQAIESVATLSGQPVVLAFDARKNGAGDPDGNIELVEVVQVFGQAGGESAPVTTVLTGPLTAFDLTWRRFVFTGTLPTVTGKVISNGHHLIVRVHITDSAAPHRFRMTGAVFQRGAADPGYSPRGRVVETLLCSRFYENSRNADGQTPGLTFAAGVEEVGLWDTGFDGAGKVRTLGRRYLVPKYQRNGSVVAPVVTWRGTTATVNRITEGAATQHPVTSADVRFDHSGFPEITTPPAAGTLLQFRGYFTAEAEILP